MSRSYYLHIYQKFVTYYRGQIFAEESHSFHNALVIQTKKENKYEC